MAEISSRPTVRPERLPRLLRRAGELAAALLFPPVCPICGTAVADSDAVCARCWTRLVPITPPVCPVMGTPLPPDAPPGTLSAEAIAAPPPFERARAAMRYGEAAAGLVHALKYRDRPELARLLATQMIRAGADLLADKPLLVPVPLHARRLFARRYNQSALLAAEIARRERLDHAPAALQRLRRTRPQVGLSAGERARNVAGAFRVAERQRPRLAGRRVLLVDDVYTSGATARAAARALIRGGAAAVDVLSFACVVRDGRTDFAEWPFRP